MPEPRPRKFVTGRGLAFGRIGTRREFRGGGPHQENLRIRGKPWGHYLDELRAHNERRGRRVSIIGTFLWWATKGELVRQGLIAKCKDNPGSAEERTWTKETDQQMAELLEKNASAWVIFRKTSIQLSKGDMVQTDRNRARMADQELRAFMKERRVRIRSFLDVGCGARHGSPATANTKRMLGSKVKVVGLDVQGTRKPQPKNIEVRNHDITKKPTPDKFDVVRIAYVGIYLSPKAYDRMMHNVVNSLNPHGPKLVIYEDASGQRIARLTSQPGEPPQFEILAGETWHFEDQEDLTQGRKPKQ